MIGYKFVTPWIDPSIFESTAICPDSALVSITVELYVTLNELRLEDGERGRALQGKITTALNKMVAELNNKPLTQGEKI